MDHPVPTIIAVIVLLLVVLWTLQRIAQSSKQRGGFVTTIYEWDHGLLYVNGKFDRILSAGRHFTWPRPNRHDIFTLRRREQFEYTQPVDATSKDGLVFRMSAAIGYRIVDPRHAHEEGYLEKIRMAASNSVVRL